MGDVCYIAFCVLSIISTMVVADRERWRIDTWYFSCILFVLAWDQVIEGEAICLCDS